jgi:glycerate kinase
MTSNPRILICPTAFKGTLTPSQAAHLMHKTIHKFRPRWKLVSLPLADGGDGTLDVLLTAFKGKKIKTKVTGPLGNSVVAEWGQIKNTAVIEMARASGLALVKGKNQVMEATSFGTGELIKAALDKGCRTILIGVGGTATADGGAGALQALGLNYLDQNGTLLSSRPLDLLRLKKVDWSGLDPRLNKTKIVVLCDVKNPLLGPNGSARVFGPQKGATDKQVKILEQFLLHWSRFAKIQTKNKPGSGAAGALAYGLSAFLGARLVKGCSFIFQSLNWKKFVTKSNIIITGEGRLDKTSFSGKVIGEVLRQRHKAKVFVICGTSPLSESYREKKNIIGAIELGAAGIYYPQKKLTTASQKLIEIINHVIV